MSTATVTSKGQITLPKDVRESMGLDAGDKVDFVRDAEGGFRVVPRRRDIGELRGMFAGRVTKPVTLQEMEHAILDEAGRRFERAVGRKKTR